MKTNKFKLLLTVMFLSVGIYASAYSFTVDGIYYNKGINGTCEVTYGDAKYSGEIVIPEKVTHDGEIYAVTKIGNAAFAFCPSLTNVTIPGSVITIEESAFQSCSSLINIIILNSVTTIGRSAFDRCSALSDIIIPNSVTTIGRSAFSFCI